MASLYRLFLLLTVLGLALHMGWVQTAGLILADALGIVLPAGGNGWSDLEAILGALAYRVRVLPEPWFSIVALAGGSAAVAFLVSFLGTLARAFREFGLRRRKLLN